MTQDNNVLYVHHHSGMGDHILCNGLIRYLSKRHDKIYLITKNNILHHIKRMYQDSNNIELLPFDSDAGFYLEPGFNELKKNFLNLRYVHFMIDEYDKKPYKMANVPFEERWKSWYIDRNNLGVGMINKMNLPDRYCLIHRTCSQCSYDIHIETKLPVIEVNKMNDENTLFDWIPVIENATEIHVIDSVFLHLADSLDISGKRLYYHMNREPGIKFTFKNKWECVK